MSHERPWLSERVVSPALAKTLIENQFPVLAPVQIAPLGTGWDNTVYSVNQTWAFRFPRREMALSLMDTEWQLLAHLAPHLALQIPVPRFNGQPSPAFDWPFAGFSLVPGQTACRARLSGLQRQALIVPMAEFLKTLHHFPLAQTLDLPPDHMKKVDVALRVPQIMERLAQAQTLGLLSSDAPWLSFLADLPPETPLNRPRCLVHGDLYIRHLVVDHAGHLNGVIDWGDAHLGDPACDFSAVFSLLPPETHETFWQHYGPVSAETLKLARMRAIFHNLALLLYASDTRDADLEREARQGLAWCAEP
ncbi:MAG: phosphotransferase [Candidatus Sericytochromatia bacterium]